MALLVALFSCVSVGIRVVECSLPFIVMDYIINRKSVNEKNAKLWAIHIMSFFFSSYLNITGLINWLMLPKGYELRGSSLIFIRHFLIEVHQWAGSIFIIIVAVHVILHWGYIKAQVVKSGNRA
jgi:hypothetical protein